MKKTLLLCIFFAFQSLPAQTHLWQSRNYSSAEPVNRSRTDFVQPQIQNSELASTVFGFLPYWEYLDSAYTRVRWDLISHIGLFDFAVDSAGVVSSPVDWPWNPALDSAAANKVQVIMTIADFDSNSAHYLISNAASKNNFYQNVKSLISAYGFAGVNIDFEVLKASDKSQPIVSFLSELSAVLNANFGAENIELSFSTPAVNWRREWDLDGIANVCDYIYILAYDFHGAWSTNTGPTAPLTGNFGYNLNSMLQTDYKNIIQNSPAKIIMGVPYYGLHWETKSDSAGTKPTKFVFSTRYRDAVELADKYGEQWFSDTQTPWITWQDTVYHQIWYDNETSLSLKYDLVKSMNLGGIGIWALGYDGTRPELWELIDKKFGAGAVDVEHADAVISGQFELLGNYPNPFNPSTTISFQIPESGEVSLSVFNTIGELIFNTERKNYAAGENKIYLNFSSINPALSSGLYLYRLSYYRNGIVSNRLGRMILMK